MLGVVDHKFIIREKDKIGKLAYNNLRKIEEKESYRWIESYRRAKAIAKTAPNTKFVCVADREGDIIELFAEADGTVDLIVRSYQNRNVEEKGVKKSLSCAIDEAPIIGQTEFILAPRRKKIPISQAIKDGIKKKDRLVNKKKRVVRQNIRVTSLVIQPPAHKQFIGKVNLQVIHLEEIDPPQGEDPICWTLFTTLKIDNLQEAQEVIQIYLARWAIEVFFYVLKEGCKIEHLQLKTAPSVFECVALYLIVAWRVMYVMFLGRNCPDLPCSLVFDEDEWKCIYATVKQCKPPNEPPKLGDFIIMLASLGGYIKRKECPYPGPKIMWRALQMLVGCAIGWRAYREFGN